MNSNDALNQLFSQQNWDKWIHQALAMIYKCLIEPYLPQITSFCAAAIVGMIVWRIVRRATIIKCAVCGESKRETRKEIKHARFWYDLIPAIHNLFGYLKK